MPKISISYRRADSEAMTGRIFDRLTSHFGKDAIFRDIDDIPPGIDFRVHINETLRKTNILLAIVGPAWLGESSGGPERIQEESDPVRVEVETALRRGVAIIPVLIGATRMPSSEQLPPGLKDFTYRNAVKVDTGQDFDYHMDRLIRAMDSILGQRPKSPSGETKLPGAKSDAGSRQAAATTDAPGKRPTGPHAVAAMADSSAEKSRPSFTVTLPRVLPQALWPADRGGQYVRLAIAGAVVVVIAVGLGMMLNTGGDEHRLLPPLRGHTGTVSTVAFSPNAGLVASGSYDKTVRIWETSNGTALRTLPGDDAVYAVAFEPNGKRVISGGNDGVIVIRDAENGQRTDPPLRPEASYSWDRLPAVLALAVAADGTRLASGHADATLKIWNFKTGALLHATKRHTDAVTAVVYAPDGKTIVTGSADGTVRTWDADSGQSVLVFPGHAGPVFTVAISPDGNRIAAGGSGPAVLIWNLTTMKQQKALATEMSAVNALAFTQGGGHLAVGGSDAGIQIWDVEAGQLLRSLPGHSGSIRALAVSADGRRFASGSEDKTVGIWSAK